MPIRAQCQSENGVPLESLHDVGALLTAVERAGKDRFGLIRYIDPYGDTTFNELMLPDVAKDLDNLLLLAISKDERRIGQQLRRMVDRCLEMHVYLKFIGD